MPEGGTLRYKLIAVFAKLKSKIGGTTKTGSERLKTE